MGLVPSLFSCSTVSFPWQAAQQGWPNFLMADPGTWASSEANSGFSALRWKGWRIRDFFVVQHSGGGNVSSENWDVFGVFLMQVLVQFFESSWECNMFMVCRSREARFHQSPRQKPSKTNYIVTSKESDSFSTHLYITYSYIHMTASSVIQITLHDVVDRFANKFWIIPNWCLFSPLLGEMIQFD